MREKCRRVLGDGDDASDVAQETFIRFWKHCLRLLEHLVLGLKRSLSEQLGFASTGLVHLLSLNLAIVATMGPAR